MYQKIRLFYSRFYDVFSKFLSIFLNITLVLLIMMVAVNVFNGSDDILGYKFMYVQSGSMEPYMMTGGISVGKDVADKNSIKEGDVMSYQARSVTPGETITVVHRVKSIDSDGNVVMRGDNNRVDDNVSITINDLDYKIVYVNNSLPISIISFFKSKSSILGGAMLIAGLIILLRTIHKELYFIENEKILIHKDIE